MRVRDRQQAAAVVNGEVISQDDVQTTYDQLRAAKYDFTENVVLTALIAAPLLEKPSAVGQLEARRDLRRRW